MTDSVLYDEDGSIALLTLNRPDKLNALDYATVDALAKHLDAIEDRPDLRAVILTGKGRAFSAGADIAEFAGSVKRGVEPALKEFLKRGQTLTARIESFGKPVIAAVNGMAFGGGCEVVEACAMAVASERALFGKPEIKLGITPTFGGTQRLPRLIGRKRALKMILTGDPITAADAAELGLVSDVVRHSQLMMHARNLAHRVIAWSPIAVTACLRSVTRGVNVPIDEGLAIEASQFAVTVPTQDSQEGIAAFLEKRTPQFRGA
ncbi:MAG: crotonase/enoyl-CoA hydratase family protein [Pseudolabrys sp.]